MLKSTSGKRSISSAIGEEDAFRQLTIKNNLQLITPKPPLAPGSIKNHGDEKSNGLHGSVAELVRAASTRCNRMQIIMSVLATLTVLSSGMGLGYSAITLHSLTREDDPLRFNPEQASWFASICSIACPFGGLMAGYFLDRIGRKYTLVFINVLSIVSWGLIAVSSSHNFDLMYTQIMIARVIIGLVIGLVGAAASIYSAEIATPQMRGRLTLLTSLQIAVGVLMIYTFGYLFPENFRLVAAIAAACCVVSFLLLIPLPESPAWLMSKEREEDAERSLKRIRGYGSCRKTIPDIEHELAQFRDNLTAQRTSEKEPLSTMIKQPQIYKPLVLIISFFGFQQFSGTFVVIVYAAQVSSEAGVSMEPFLCTVLIGITRVVATIMVAYILDSLGRKPPAIFSGIGMAVCMLGVTICIHYPPSESLNWIPTFLIISYVFTSTVGFITMPFTLLAELFPQKIRGPASGVSIFFAYLMSFIIIKLYPVMIDNMGSSSVFIFYGIVSLLGVFFVWYFIPETKGKSLQEIEDYFRDKPSIKLSSQLKDDATTKLASSTV